MLKEQSSTINSLAHTRWGCEHYIVFAPKYSRKVFCEEKRIAVEDISRNSCLWKGVEIIEGEICSDHVHLLLFILPKMRVSFHIKNIEKTIS